MIETAYEGYAKRFWDIPDYTDVRNWMISFDDATIVISSAIVFTFIRWVVQDLFYKFALSLKGDKRAALGFSESAWKTVWYSTSLAAGCYIVHYSDFWPETRKCWTNFPDYISGSHRYYYLFELGFYFHSLVSHFFFEIKRSDYWILAVHHAVTIGLIWFSLVVGFWKIGTLILVVHDVCDVPLEAAKAARSLEMKNTATAGFVVLIILWICTRMSVYPYKLIYSTYAETHMEIPPDVMPFHFGFNAALMSLQVMHIYWFFLIIRAAIRTLTKGHVDDVREKDE